MPKRTPQPLRGEQLAERLTGKRLVLFLTPDEHRELKVLAAQRGTTMSALVLAAVRASLASVVTTHGAK